MRSFVWGLAAGLVGGASGAVYGATFHSGPAGLGIAMFVGFVLTYLGGPR